MESCSICLEEMGRHIHKLERCGHTFHVSCLSKCVSEYIKRNFNLNVPCPLCREDVFTEDEKERLEEQLRKSKLYRFLRKCYKLVKSIHGVWTHPYAMVETYEIEE